MHNENSGMCARRAGPNVSEAAIEIDREDRPALTRLGVRHASVGLADQLLVGDAVDVMAVVDEQFA